LYNKCVECGFCKNDCPVYKIVLKESVSPRGLAIISKKEVKDKIIYACSLCKDCRESCPLDLDLDFREFREKVVNSGVETEANKEMIKNIREFGNPYGKLEGKKPKYLFC
jgi:heterodisulfide reductase subunit D